MRPETGTLRFAGDWTSVFIRVDNAFFCATVLKSNSYPEEIEKIDLGWLDRSSRFS
jgi:hypothetical protein